MYMIRQSFPDSWQDRTCRIHLFFLFLLLRSINILMDDIEEGAVAFKLGLDTMGWNPFQRSIGKFLYILVFPMILLCQEFKKKAVTSNEAPSERLSSRCVLLQTIAHMSLFESFLKTWSGLIFFQLNGMEWYKEFIWSKMKNKPVLVLVFGWWKLQFWKPHSNAKSAFCTNWCTNL